MAALAATCSRLAMPVLREEWPDLPKRTDAALETVIRSIEAFDFGGWNDLSQLVDDAPNQRAARVVGILMAATFVLQTAHAGLQAERMFGHSTKGQTSLFHLQQLLAECAEIKPALAVTIRKEFQRIRSDKSLTLRCDPFDRIIEVNLKVRELYSIPPSLPKDDENPFGLCQDWASMCRLYIASMDKEFLNSAVNTCAIPSIVELLRREVSPAGGGSNSFRRKALVILNRQNRTAEAAILELLPAIQDVCKRTATDSIDDPRHFVNHCEQLILVCRQHGFTECEAHLLFLLGSQLAELGNDEESLLMLRYVATVFQRLSVRWPNTFQPLLANTLYNIGAILARTGKDGASVHYRQAISILKTRGTSIDQRTPYLYVHILEGLAVTVKQSTGAKASLPHYERALSEYKRLARRNPDTRMHVGRLLNILGDLYAHEQIGNLSGAERMKRKALSIFMSASQSSAIDYLPCIAMTRMGLGEFRMKRDDARGALRHFKTALGEWARIRDKFPHLECDYGLCCQLIAETCQKLGKTREARSHYESAMKSWRKARLLRDDRESMIGFRNTAAAYAALLRMEGELQAANDMYAKANDVERTLSLMHQEGKDETDIMEDLMETLNERAISLRDAGKFNEAEEVLNEALDYSNGITDKAPVRLLELRAQSLTNAFAVLNDRRFFSLATLRGIEALEIYGLLQAKSPDTYADDVASMLRNLATVSNPDQAMKYALKSASIRRGLLKRHLVEDQKLAGSLETLSMCAFNAGKRALAFRSANEALTIRKRNPQKVSSVYCLYLLGALQCQARDYVGSKKRLDEAVQISRRFARPDARWTWILSALHDVRRRVVANLPKSSNAKASNKDTAAAIAHGERWLGESSMAWLGRGLANESYQEYIRTLAQEGSAEKLLIVIASLREGMSISEASKHTPSRLFGAPRAGIDILIAQSTRPDEVLLGVLNSQHRKFMCKLSSTFVRAAQELENCIEDLKSGSESEASLSSLAVRAWKELPDFCRAVLDGKNKCEVLLSADSRWSVFPWEALRSSKELQSSIGLHKALTRWDCLFRNQLSRLKAEVFGHGGIGATIVCPWDADPRNLLPYAKSEGESIASFLSKVGFTLLPHGRALCGSTAQSSIMVEVLKQQLAIFHFSGHMLHAVDDEVLKVHPSGADVEGFFLDRALRKREDLVEGIFGVQNIYLEKTRSKRSCLISSGPLVVLNCCDSGRRRAFEGRFVDLGSTFIHEGALGVISSNLLMNDMIGELTGKALYDPSISAGVGMGEVTQRVRRLLCSVALETAHRAIHAHWITLRFHGNPFARLPLLPGLKPHEASKLSRRFFDDMGKAFGVATNSKITRAWKTGWTSNEK